jgi:hypothetical protein
MMSAMDLAVLGSSTRALGIDASSGVVMFCARLEELVRRAAAVAGEPNISEPSAWWQARAGSPPTYPTVLAEIATTQDERRVVLAEFFERRPEDTEQGLKAPTAGHRALARVAAGGLGRIFLTTNFDLLLEALRDEGVEPVVVSTPEAITGMEPLHAQRCAVVHLRRSTAGGPLLNQRGRYAAPSNE